MGRWLIKSITTMSQEDERTIRYGTLDDSIIVSSVLKDYANTFVGTDSLVLNCIDPKSRKDYHIFGRGPTNMSVYLEYLPIKNFQRERVFLPGRLTKDTMELSISSEKKRLSLHTYKFEIKNMARQKTLEDYFEAPVDVPNVLRDTQIYIDGASSFVLKNITLRNKKPTLHGLTHVEASVRFLPIKKSEANKGVYYPADKERTAKITALVNEKQMARRRKIKSLLSHLHP